MLCSCPPFECTCNKSRPSYKSFLPTYDLFKEPLQTVGPFTQINITNAYPIGPGPSLDLFLHGADSSRQSRGCNFSMGDNKRLMTPAVSISQANLPFSQINPRASASPEVSGFENVQYQPRDTFTQNAMVADGEHSSRDVTPMQQRLELSPHFLGEQSSSDGAPPLLGDRLAGGPCATSGFLSASTEALFGGLPRVDDVYTVPRLKSEPQDLQHSFCGENRQHDITISQCDSLQSQTTNQRHVSHSGEENIVLTNSCRKVTVSSVANSQVLGLHTTERTVNSSSHSNSFGDVSPTNPGQGHGQFDKKFEELRPVRQREQHPRTAYDILHNPLYYRDDPTMHASNYTRTKELSSGGLTHAQQYTGSTSGLMHMRNDNQVTSNQMGGENGSPLYGRCQSDCLQRSQSSQPYTNLFKQPCNHSINITLTYN